VSKPINIIAVETLPLAMEGLAGILAKTNIRCHLSFADSLDEAELIYLKQKCRVIIVNPSFFFHNSKLFNSFKSKFSEVKWVGLVFGWHEPSVLTMFDALISAADSPKTVEDILNKLIEEDEDNEQSPLQEILSGREIDVLKLLATGLANKEIADQLNISIHTVISHRKNISQKTGIKSVSGLTIYAVTQKLISIDKLNE
jgi:DNA-binding NarL/FixJ family response regulator